MAVLKFVGRLLITTLILASAYQHLLTPQRSVELFKSNHSQVEAIAEPLLQIDIPSNHNWSLLVKIFGLFEVLTALLIIFGDGLGGFFYFVTLVGEFALIYGSRIASMKLCQSDASECIQIAQFVGLIGISITLMCGRCNRSKCSK